MTIYPVVLEILDRRGLLSGKVVSVDGLGCRREPAKSILRYGADCLINLKGDQATIPEDVKAPYGDGPGKFPEGIEFEGFALGLVKIPLVRVARRI